MGAKSLPCLFYKSRISWNCFQHSRDLLERGNGNPWCDRRIRTRCPSFDPNAVDPHGIGSLDVRFECIPDHRDCFRFGMKMIQRKLEYSLIRFADAKSGRRDHKFKIRSETVIIDQILHVSIICGIGDQSQAISAMLLFARSIEIMKRMII